MVQTAVTSVELGLVRVVVAPNVRREVPETRFECAPLQRMTPGTRLRVLLYHVVSMADWLAGWSGSGAGEQETFVSAPVAQ